MALILAGSHAVMASASEDGLRSTGTGFAVSRQGHLLTNFHVVENCHSVRGTANGEQKELTIVATDKKNDLAIVKWPGPLSNMARFRNGRSIRSGDSIVVVGFPFHGVLASEANVTTGTVSAMAGLGNDTRFMQIAAPVQPGNSGGPVLDKSGHLVGIVESKLNALAMALITGDIPQNVNFAIKDQMAKLFLDSQNVTYETAASEKPLEPAEIGEAAKQFTFLLACYSQNTAEKHRTVVEAERRALKAERRALDEERRALARRQEEREFAIRLEQEERMQVAREIVQNHDESERQAAEQERRREQTKKETLREAEIARERVPFSAEEERAREAKKKAERQALDGDPQILEKALRKGQEARARALRSEPDEPIQIAKEMAPQIAPLPTVNRIEAILKGSTSTLSNPYWARVQSIISSQWEPPPINTTAHTYAVTVTFRLRRDGTIKDVAVQQSSGNVYFDSAAQRAVLRTRFLSGFPAWITETHQDLSMVFTTGELSR